MPPSESREPRRVREMFGSIAPRYDLLNHLLSFNLDRRWRRRAVRELAPDSGARVLDLCGGTGDLSVELAREVREGVVVCCDFCQPMLELARSKFRKKRLDDRCVVLGADGLRLPFREATFDAVTVAFGVRNFADLDAGLREIGRVLRPSGRLVVLEFSTLQAPVMSRLYRFYLDRVLPRLGDSVSGESGPYGYLARTIGEFPDVDLLAGRIREAGFAAVGWTTMTGGIVAVHTAIK
ncbi:MAG: bifunctional demethylmenaquinone methyltransferase/2-methoxy-6-polyprenyl-1,4-benzoquinol methylase UbiE [Acidobacteriota bacterium]|nr:bifunctional demethylmenaquinone methyltransferase/2-methoxy-6-polyprenyl-1,4-benzoquinol methylase UbiE [Acidobacteriota bacterium]